jgi:signal transduction histidine kinase
MLALVFRGLFPFAVANILAGHLLAVAGFEARYRGVRQFCGLGPPRLVSLLPHLVFFIVLLSFVRERAGLPSAVNFRLVAIHLLLIYIGGRTVWALLQDRTAGLSREVRFLAGVAALTALASVAMVVIVIVRPVHGDVFAVGIVISWFFLALDSLAIAWSISSMGLACGWIELHLRERDEQFRLLLDESPLATAVLGADGSFERLNRKFVETTGYTLRDIPDEEHWFALVCAGPVQRARARAVWRDVVNRANAHPPSGPVREMVIDCRGAPSRTIEPHARRVGDRVVVQLVDVTELKAALQARDQLVAAVSHDLKSPLSAIQLRVETAIPDSPKEQLTDQLRSIRRAAANMERTIHELLDAVSVDSGGLVLALAPTSIKGVIASVVELVSPVMAKRSLKLECDVGWLPEVNCDGERLTRVLINLLDNAVKFTDEGTITIRAEERAGGVQLSVTDTGRGISPEVLPHVFDRYFTTTPGGQGTGIGLYMAKEIIEAHNGRIWASSEPGHGSTFAFTLPQSPVERAPALTTPFT